LSTGQTADVEIDVPSLSSQLVTVSPRWRLEWYRTVGVNPAGILGDAEADPEGLVGAMCGVHRGEMSGEGPI